MGQGRAHIYRFKFPWMDEFVSEPRVFGGIEGLYQPIDGVSHARDAAAGGVIGEPDVERPAHVDVERPR